MHEEKRPSAVDVSDEDRSVTSDITFQSATMSRSIERLLRMAADKSKPGGMVTRRFPEPHASQPSNDHIDAIIQLKLQVAQQKEMIDCLTSDLNNALSEKRALLSKANQPAKPKPIFTLVSLAEEKAHSDNSRSLHKQYNELREEMSRLQISMGLQQEKMAAVEADNRSLTNERNSLRIQIAKMDCKTAGSAYSPAREPSGSQDFTANLTEFSGLSGSEIIPSSDMTGSCCRPRRASAVDQSQSELAHSSYLPWSKVKRRSSEPVYFHGQRDNTREEFFASPKEANNDWFVGDENEGSFLPRMIHRNEGTKFAEDDKQALYRRSSMPDKLTPTAMTTSSLHPRRRSCINMSRRSDIVVHESYRSYIQSEKITNGGDFKCIVWGESDSDSSSEIY